MGIVRVIFVCLFILATPIPSAFAQENAAAPAPNICYRAYASVRDNVIGTVRDVRDLGVSAGRGISNYARAIRDEGWRRAFVRSRTVEERGQSYRDYFLPAIENLPENAGIKSRLWERLAHPTNFTWNGQRRIVSPSSGIIQSLDRWLLGEERTLTAPIRFVPIFGVGAVASYYVMEELYEKPLSRLEQDQNFKGAVAFSLNYEPAFAVLRQRMERAEAERQEAVRAGKMTPRQAAEAKAKEKREVDELVGAELISRRNFFEIIRLQQLNNPNTTIEEIAVWFMRGNPNDPSTRIDLRNPSQASILRDSRARTVFRDLQRFFNPEFQQKFLEWEEGKKPDFNNLEVQERIFADLFALNLDRMAAVQVIPRMLERGFKPEEVRATDRLSYDIYEALMADPFTKALIEYQRRNPNQLKHEDMLSLLLSDFEWRVRFLQVEAMGARFKIGDEVKTFEDYRRELLERRGIVLPGWNPSQPHPPAS